MKALREYVSFALMLLVIFYCAVTLIGLIQKVAAPWIPLP
jgi:hypothetical protein